MNAKKKCIVMFSGGLDSRLAIKIMQERGYDVLALFFNLPFGEGCCSHGCSFNFSQMQGVKLVVFDCTKGTLLKEYLKVISQAKHGTGAGVNPCVDCRIFMFSKTKEYADSLGIESIVTGEVAGQRPMSQQKHQIKLIERRSELEGRIIRPLIDRGFSGRRRADQIALAKKFDITYPDPAGGCLLCEKFLKKRLKYILDRGIAEKEMLLVGIGRHFVIDKHWIVIGRDHEENLIIERVGKNYGLIISESPGPSAIMIDKPTEKLKVLVSKLIEAYSKRGSLKARSKFDKYKL